MIDNGTRTPSDDFEITLEKDVVYDETSRRWFFQDENGTKIGPYDTELAAASALFLYTIEISQLSNED
jgi:hypothetical protein